MNQPVSISPAFRKSAIKAVLSIVLFIAFYLLVFACTIGLILLCGYFAVMLVTGKLSFITLVAAAGLIGFSFLILVFQVKFLFKESVTDRSGMTEISAADQPELFACIQELVTAVGTRFPKKIYITQDVNAFVFYDSSIWSMFFPVKKNLAIGLGLVNTVTATELKAILGHEFGHFSQRSMKIGSYVYNVNKVIYNMLFENDGYADMVRGWSGIHNLITLFVMGAVRFVQAIQWVLSRIYRLINIHHLSLSRAMEFHADAVAASVTGSRPLITSLLRLNLAEHAYTQVLNFYGPRLKDRIHSANIYPEQWQVMLFEAQESRIPLVAGFPEVTPEEMGRFNRSKLVIKNQWASHPETEERISHLQQLDLPERDNNQAPAWTLFRDKEALQELLTRQLFARAVAETGGSGGATSLMDLPAFSAAYEEAYRDSNFPALYHGYYDHHNLAPFNLEAAGNHSRSTVVFNSALGEQAAAAYALEQDLQVLRQIATGTTTIKYFDYDGRKYMQEECSALITKLEADLELAAQQLHETDQAVYRMLAGKAAAEGGLETLQQKYRNLFNLEAGFEALKTAYAHMRRDTQFMFETLEPHRIRQHLQDLYQTELLFRKQVRLMLDGPEHKASLTPEVQTDLEAYMAGQHVYFDGSNYDDTGTKILFTAINQYEYLVGNSYFRNKKDLLEFQAQLIAQPAGLTGAA